jgi:hypothetical protein
MFDPSLLQPLPPGVTAGRIDAALDASRGVAEGRNREQIRELLVAELRARGLMLSPPSVDSLVDLIAAGPIQRQAQRLAGLGNLAGLALRSVSAAIQHQPLPSWIFSGARLVRSTLGFRQTEVILDRDVGEHLAVGDANTIEVWLGLAAFGSPDKHRPPEAIAAADEPVTVFRGDYRVGVLDPEASAAWRPLVHRGHDESHAVVTFATRQQADGGEWRLLIGFPYTPSNHQGNEDGRV